MTSPTSRPRTPASGRGQDDDVEAVDLRPWKAMAYVITGPVLYGGIGFGLDRWLGTSWLVLAGILLGTALSLYVVWVRYGTQ